MDEQIKECTKEADRLPLTMRPFTPDEDYNWIFIEECTKEADRLPLRMSPFTPDEDYNWIFIVIFLVALLALIGKYQ